jgi:hypothetical protein
LDLNSTPSYAKSHPDSTESLVYRDAQVDCRSWSTDQLLAALEVVNLDIEDPDDAWPGDVGRHLAGERRRAYEVEVERRVRIVSIPGSKAAKYTRDFEEWAELARTVRELVSVPEVLLLIGYPPTRAGNEYHGPCPVCRDGVDRLVSWDGPNSRCWCRRCGWKASGAISVAMSFMPGCQHFRDAVRSLARLAEVEAGR